MARSVSKRGRYEQGRSQVGRTRKPNLQKFYRFTKPEIRPGEFVFYIDVLKSDKKPVRIDRLVDSLEWSEDQAVLTGSITLNRPNINDPNSVPIQSGNVVRCKVKWGGVKYELWRMRCKPPEVQLEDGSITVELVDDLDILNRTRRDWSFRKTKHRKYGYFPHDIVREVARRQGVKLGQVARGRHRINKIVKPNASPLDVIREAYQHERDKTGRRFVIRMRNGRLEVVPYRRNLVVYVFEKQLQSVAITREEAVRPVTVIEARGHIGKGKNAKKVKHVEYVRSVVRRFGYVHQDKNYGRVGSLAELRNKAKRDLAKGIKAKQTASFSHPGIPFIHRGDAVKLNLPKEGFKGEDSFVFLTSVRHRVTAGEYVTECEVSADDLFFKYQLEREKELRAKKRKERKKRKKAK